MVNYATPWVSSDSQNQWRTQVQQPTYTTQVQPTFATQVQPSNVSASGFGGQNSGTPTYGSGTLSPAWSVDKSGTPAPSMFANTIGGDVYTTTPYYGGANYAATDGAPRNPVPARPTTPTTPTTPSTPATGTQPGTLSPWNPYQPTAGYTPGQALNLPNVAAQNPTGYQNTAAWWANQNNANAMSSWLPYGQYEQNRYQYTQDFNEAQRRYDAEMAWRQATDQYNMGLSTRQQQSAEWQAAEAARQWQEQFGYTQQRDAQEFQLANDQLAVERAYRQGLITNEQRNLALQELTQQQNNLIATGQLQLSRDELAALQQWRNTDAGLRQKEIDAGTLQARYAAFGRAQAPGAAKYLRNW